MPEYLAPGVFVEEVSFRAKSIEGVATSTTGIAGRTRFGPVGYPGGPIDHRPRLVTSFSEFERVYGSVDPLDSDQMCYVAHAARAFFQNNGVRLWVSRVFTDLPTEVRPAGLGAHDPGRGIAVALIKDTGGSVLGRWQARWPGRMGNVTVTVRPVRSGNVAATVGGALVARGARNGAIVEVVTGPPGAPKAGDPLDATKLRRVIVDASGAQTFSPTAPDPAARLHIVELEVTVHAGPSRTDVTPQLGADPTHRRYLGSVLGLDDPDDETTTVVFVPNATTPPNALALAAALTSPPAGSPADAPKNVGVFPMDGGTDGAPANADDLNGKFAEPDDPVGQATGLRALADVEDIAIVMMPDAAGLDADERTVATQYLIAHAEAPGAYRIAIVDPPAHASLNEVREFRGGFDSSYAALYYPWVEILDPTQPSNTGTARAKLYVPPSGFVAGIYARSDVARGVFKAPANEVVNGLTRFEANVNTARQQILNPDGINALRFFEGRGHRIWGARTLSSDSENMYVNVRRFLIFLEHSVYRASAWAVFEPNGPALWSRISQAVRDFLEVQWRDGALLGATRNEAFFVRCDRSTMIQNDLDNGRLICLVGVAIVRPAEFVIFRVGQFTADAQN